jgi:predicted CXXCH cytochrome family protein
MCADCHSTYLEKNYDEQTNSYDTKWAIIDVSCEACHGPGAKHLEYVNSGSFKNGEKIKGSFLHLTSSLDNKQQVEECARCHARRGPQTNVFDHSGGLLDHYLTETLRPGLYHSDGQILDEVYVYGSFTQSKMYRNQVYCTSCHDPHSLKLKFDGNALCTQCHEPEKYDVETHHFHKADTEGAACINCHMPGKFYMVNDFRRDHSFRIPRPDLSVTYDTPNACNQCHSENDADWADEAINKWYGDKRRPHFSPALAAAQSGNLYALPSLIQMVGDTSFPVIAQASALNIFGQVNTQETNQKIVESLKNSNPLIRYSAMNALENFSAEDRLRFVSPLLKDSVRTIRTNAVYILADVDESLYRGDLKEVFQKAKKEFENVLKIQADFPAGQVMRGQYYQKKGDFEKAEKAYLEAIRQDPYLTQPKYNLANLYYSQRNLQAAKEYFEKVVELDPNSGDTYYSLGLLLAEMKNLKGAERALGKASNLTGDPRHYYNWGLTLQNLERSKEAENAYKKALEISPDSEGILYALAILYIQQNRKKDAQNIVMKLLQINPQNKDYQNLLKATR